MNVSDFDYDLPSNRIAQAPVADRTASRLLDAGCRGPIQDRVFYELPNILAPNDLLILNDTRVLPARVFGSKVGSGGRVEILVERLTARSQCIAQIRANKKLVTGSRLITDDGTELMVGRMEGSFHQLRLISGKELRPVLEAEGRIPLPPYIRRAVDLTDSDRYQTVYAREPGAIAAPTAGLHFDTTLLAQLEKAAIQIRYLTLHVGSATFQPIRVQDIYKHHMHKELFSISGELVEAVAQTKNRGGRVVAVGTTVVRALESAARTGTLVPMKGDTDLFIAPGFEFRVVDLLITNFHLPKSSLLVLVSAFAGLENIRRIYAHAIDKRYRFYSYGDAMRVGRKEVFCEV